VSSRDRSGPPYDVSSEFSKIAPPLYREPRSPHSTRASPLTLRNQAANLTRAPSLWFCTTLTAFSSPTLPGYCTELPVMGFMMFHRRDSDSPSCFPALRSFDPHVQQVLRQVSPPPSPGPRHLSEFPRSVHREPCPLILSIRSSLSVSSTLTHGLNASVAAILVQLSLNSKTSSQMPPESRGFPPHTKPSFQPPFPVV